jgi:hypothetical protein
VKRLLFAIALAACTPAPKAAAPVWVNPPAAHQLLPIDLDFVVRLDTERLRATQAFAGVTDEIGRHASSGLFHALRPAFAKSRAVFLGGRTFADGFQGDGVLAIEGTSDSIVADPPFVAIESARPEIQLFERASDVRGEPVLEANCGEGGIALATAAEADALLRLVRDGPDRGRLEPRAHGAISFVGRATPNAASTDADTDAGGTGDVWQKVRRGLQSFDGSVDFAAEIEANVDLQYDSPNDAVEANGVAQRVVARLAQQQGPLKTLANSVRLSPRDQTLGLRFTVPLELLAALEQVDGGAAPVGGSAAAAGDGGAPAAR